MLVEDFLLSLRTALNIRSLSATDQELAKVAWTIRKAVFASLHSRYACWVSVGRSEYFPSLGFTDFYALTFPKVQLSGSESSALTIHR